MNQRLMPSAQFTVLRGDVRVRQQGLVRRAAAQLRLARAGAARSGGAIHHRQQRHRVDAAALGDLDLDRFTFRVRNIKDPLDFERLVLCCIEADFCKYTAILRHYFFRNLLRCFAHFCTGHSSTCDDNLSRMFAKLTLRVRKIYTLSS